MNLKNDLSELVQKEFSDGKCLTDRIIEIINMSDDDFINEFENKIIHEFRCHIHYDQDSIVYYKMLIFNKMMGFFGINGDGEKYSWLNSGDVYNLTLCYNYDSKEFFVKCPGDLDIDEAI